MMHQYRGVAYIFLTAFLWSLGGLLYRMVDWNATLIAGFTSLIAFVIMGIWRRSFKVKVTKFVILTAVCSCLTNLTFVYANQLTTAANAIVLQYISPVFCLLYACLFHRQKPTAKQIAVIFVALSGLVLFFFGKLDSGQMLGNLFAIVSGIIFGAVFFLNTLPQAKPADSSMLAQLFAAVMAIPFLSQIPSVNTSSLTGILLIGVLQMGISSIAFAKGIQETESVTANLICLLETIMSPLWVFIAYGERPGAYAVLGAVILMSAVVLNIIWEGKEEAKEALAEKELAREVLAYEKEGGS